MHSCVVCLIPGSIGSHPTDGHCQSTSNQSPWLGKEATWRPAESSTKIWAELAQKKSWIILLDSKEAHLQSVVEILLQYPISSPATFLWKFTFTWWNFIHRGRSGDLFGEITSVNHLYEILSQGHRIHDWPKSNAFRICR